MTARACSAGTDVVFVHGWAGSAAAWRPILDRFEGLPGFRAQALTLPGSPGARTTAAPTIAGAVDELIGMLRGFVAPAVLVGHSMGAQVTMRAQAAVPELVSSEVVVDPAYGADAGDRAALIDWARRIDETGHAAVEDFFAAAATGLPASVGERLLADLHATPAPVLATYLRSEYLDDDAIGLLPAATAVAALRTRPVLALQSSSAGVLRERRLPSPPGSRIDLWGGCGHFLHLEEPERFVRLVVEWASAVSPAPAPTTRAR